MDKVPHLTDLIKQTKVGEKTKQLVKDFVNQTGFSNAWEANDRVHKKLSKADKYVALTQIAITFSYGDDFDKFGAVLDGAAMVAGKIAGIGEMTGFYAKVYTASRNAIDNIENKILSQLTQSDLNNCDDLSTAILGWHGGIINGLGLAMGIRTKGYSE